MKLEECGLLDELKRVKVMNMETIRTLESIINKPNFVKGTSNNPYIIIESVTGKIINQQLITTTYYESDQENFSSRPVKIYTYINPNVKTIIGAGYQLATKLKYIRESILFDIYIRKTRLKFNKKLIEEYKKYNEELLCAISQNNITNLTEPSVSILVKDSIYKDFLFKGNF